MLPDSVTSGKSALAHLDWTTVKKSQSRLPAMCAWKTDLKISIAHKSN